ncbi:MAG: energy transducer TonB [Acidobacteriota bacterium]
MKMKFRLSVFLVVFSCALVSLAQDKERDCGFSKYKATRRSHEKEKMRVAPEYPQFAKEARIQGSIIVKVLLDEKGDVIKACGLTGHPLLWDVAQKAAMEWKFGTYTSSSLNNKNAQVYRVTVITFNFNLNQQ